MTEPNIAPSDVEAIHGILTTDFTDRYLQRSHIDNVAFSAPYDPDNPICDYNQTWWPAKPNRLSTPVGKIVLGKLHHLKGSQIDDICVSQFAKRADIITEALHDYPVMLVNGHSPDLQAALSLFACTRGLALASKNRFQPTLEDTIKISHGIATRGIAPIIIGNPKSPKNLRFMRIMQLVVNPHFSFPINKQMIASGIPQGFRHDYNARLKTQSLEASKLASEHPMGLNNLWAMSPGGTPDFPGDGEHDRKVFTKIVEAGTINFVTDMGCGLLPVYTKFGLGKSPTTMELGNIIEPSKITRDTLPTIMANLAAYRRLHGEKNVFYEGAPFG